MTSNLNGLRICIADSNPHMRKLLCDLLTFLDASDVMACKDGREALAALESFPADLFIIDLHMQPMDGMAVLKQIRAADCGQTRALPVIMVADFAERDAVAEANMQGGAEFLLKPVTIPALFTRIHESLAVRQQLEAAAIEPGPNTAGQQSLLEDRESSDADSADHLNFGAPISRVASTVDDDVLVLKD